VRTQCDTNAGYVRLSGASFVEYNLHQTSFIVKQKDITVCMWVRYTVEVQAQTYTWMVGSENSANHQCQGRTHTHFSPRHIVRKNNV